MLSTYWDVYYDYDTIFLKQKKTKKKQHCKRITTHIVSHWDYFLLYISHRYQSLKNWLQRQIRSALALSSKRQRNSLLYMIVITVLVKFLWIQRSLWSDSHCLPLRCIWTRYNTGKVGTRQSRVKRRNLLEKLRYTRHHSLKNMNTLDKFTEVYYNDLLQKQKAYKCILDKC